MPFHIAAKPGAGVSWQVARPYLKDRTMSLAEDLQKIPQLSRDRVWCRECGYTQTVNGVNATLGGGWPKHCGYTMTIDSPAEQELLRDTS